MDWKSIVRPTKGKIIFVIIFIIVTLIHPWLFYATDSPRGFGFPLPFRVYSVYGWSGKTVNEFNFVTFLIDILIFIGIYVVIGMVGSRKKKTI